VLRHSSDANTPIFEALKAGATKEN